MYRCGGYIARSLRDSSVLLISPGRGQGRSRKSGMNNALLRYRLGEINGEQLAQVGRQLEFARILECDAPRCYRHSRHKRVATGVTCLDLDNATGRLMLSSGDDGSLSLWSLDDRLDRSEDALYNKRLNYMARSQTEGDVEPQPFKKRMTDSSEGPRVVHSFETKQNKFRMYRQSSSQVAAKSTTTEESGAGQGHRFAITCLKWYSLDNGMFFTGSNDCKLKFWDTEAFECVQEIDIGHRLNQLDTDTGGTYVIAASEDYYPRLIDLRTVVSSGITNLSHRKMDCEILCCKSNPTKPQIVATGDAHGDVKLWDLRMSNRHLLTLEQQPSGRAHLRGCNDLCWDAAGSRLATTATDGKCLVWSPFSPKLPPPQQIGPSDPMRNRYKKRTSQRLLWLDNHLAHNTDYGDVQIFETNQGKLWNKIDLPTTFVNAKNSTHKKLASFFTGMALQRNSTNSTGLRLYLGTNAPSTDPGNGSIYEYLTNYV